MNGTEINKHCSIAFSEMKKIGPRDNGSVKKVCFEVTASSVDLSEMFEILHR